jgi:hypothetical protein
MGAIARAAANLVTTSGVWLKGGVNNDSFDNVTALPSAAAADGITFISSQTANNSASISFTSGLTSTYKAYKFVFVNVHPRTDNTVFQFNGSTDAGSNYNVTKTTTFFSANHLEDDSFASLSYYTAQDLAQSTSFQNMSYDSFGNGADESFSGSLTLFNPSSTTYVKHFIGNGSTYYEGNGELNNYVAGYCNTTSAVNAIQFKMASGNMDGTIYLYGIK